MTGMQERIAGRIRRVNGPVVEIADVKDAMMMELVHVGEARLVGEIVTLQSGGGVVQVYEDTTGIKPGEYVYGTGMPLSVELGPGLIGTIYDGIQRPLERILSATGTFIEMGSCWSTGTVVRMWMGSFMPSGSSRRTVPLMRPPPAGRG